MTTAWLTIAIAVLLAMVVEALTRTRSVALHIRLVETIERDLAVVAHFDDLDLHDIADVHHIFDLRYTTVGHARDVEQAILTRSEADERTEILDADHFAFVDLSHFGNLHDAKDRLACSIAALSVGRSNMHGAIFLHLDRCASFFLKATDDLTACTDDVAICGA